jgi:hypothetical protein
MAYHPSVNPSREQAAAFKLAGLTTPVNMLNLLRFRTHAIYAPQDPEHGQALSGAAAYARYSTEAGPFFRGVGGVQHWIGRPEAVLIGPSDEVWDLAFIAAYPSGQAFLDMVRHPDYQRATRHRTAGVLDSRLIRCAPAKAGAGFVPDATD